MGIELTASVIYRDHSTKSPYRSGTVADEQDNDFTSIVRPIVHTVIVPFRK